MHTKPFILCSIVNLCGGLGYLSLIIFFHIGDLQNKSRRRSPGGVFIHLLKSDNTISKDKIIDIFAKEEEDFIHTMEERKRIRKEQNQK